MIKHQKSRMLIALLVALVSEIRPVIGLLGAAFIFPEGAESDHALAYINIAMLMNFVIVFAVTYLIFGAISRRVSSK
jgi:hypothetical protein